MTLPGRPQAFRPFFLLAALDAIVGVLPWLPGGEAILPSRLSAAAWHRQELLFGMIPAVMAGFVLTVRALRQFSAARRIDSTSRAGFQLDRRQDPHAVLNDVVAQ